MWGSSRVERVLSRRQIKEMNTPVGSSVGARGVNAPDFDAPLVLAYLMEQR